MKIVLIFISFFLCQSCINTNKDNSLKEDSLRKEFLDKFENLLQNKYIDKSKDPLKQLIEESDKKYTQIVCVEGIDELVNSPLGDSIWDISIYNGDTIYRLNFDSWYCDYLSEIRDSEPWVSKYMSQVCCIKDISPTAVCIVLEKAKISSLKNEKIRLFLAVHFITLMLRTPL